MQEENAKRMLQEAEMRVYIGLGRTKAREICKNIGATVHIGRKVLYDRIRIDEYIESRRDSNIKK